MCLKADMFFPLHHVQVLFLLQTLAFESLSNKHKAVGISSCEYTFLYSSLEYAVCQKYQVTLFMKCLGGFSAFVNTWWSKWLCLKQKAVNKKCSLRVRNLCRFLNLLMSEVEWFRFMSVGRLQLLFSSWHFLRLPESICITGHVLYIRERRARAAGPLLSAADQKGQLILIRSRAALCSPI